MITQAEVETYARHISAKYGIPFADAIDEAKKDLPYLKSQAAQAAAAKAQAETPQPAAHTWDRYDEMDRRSTAEFDRNLDPQRAAMKAARRAQIEAQVKQLVAQRDALQRQINALDQEWRDNL